MILTNALAIEIYKLKISMANNLVLPCSRLIRGRCNSVGAHYGVSSRAIRDIWNRKAWSYATQHLWPLESNLSLNFHGQVCESDSISCLILSKNIHCRSKGALGSLVDQKAHETRSRESIAAAFPTPQRQIKTPAVILKSLGRKILQKV